MSTRSAALSAIATVFGVVLLLWTSSAEAMFSAPMMMSAPAAGGAPPGGGTIACDYGPPYNGSTPPPAAVQAGFTRCAANYDFTQTQSFTDSVGTHQWSNVSTWLSCSGSTSAPYLWAFKGNTPCDSSHQYITTDSGVQVLGLTYLVSDAAAAHNNNILWSNGNGLNGDVRDPFQSEYYTETVVRLAITSGACSGFCITWDTSTFTNVQGNPCFVSTDQEWDNNATSTGVGMAQWNLTCGTSSGSGTSGPVTPVNGAINTSVTTWGALMTGDNVSKFAACDYWAAGAVSGLSASAWLSCVTATPATTPLPNIFHNLMFRYVQVGPYGLSSSSWGTYQQNQTVYIQRITMWECPGYQSGACITNPVVTTHP